jgi:hypothetical protein
MSHEHEAIAFNLIYFKTIAFSGNSVVDVKLNLILFFIISDQKFGFCINFPTIKFAKVFTLISLREGTNCDSIGTLPTIVSL